ncbi:predicted protein [Nematostella vectensis]|uniref:Uncharacterized protein n=1 Tax=Nematostella vectensis TaxID=45351 RepID=A7S8C5_NEMVE|nr:uncharacterized protein LOC5511766 [Nematostella vectensis]EDO40043.1 predicted protein [Nematostella vectensis]|eukprot:XP_001632106.1 predicted protein [Nematostella vectensis]
MLLCFFVLALFQGTFSLIHVQPNMKTFSYAIKDGQMAPGKEKTLYEHSTGQPGVITEQWFTGQDVMNENATVRYYFDGEVKPSLEFKLFVAHGVGFSEKTEMKNLPWATKRLGHTANGGIYNTIPIPFGKSFRVTAENNNTGNGYYWFIIRGVENYPVVLGDLVLPPNARLRLYKNEGVTLKPFEFLPLAEIEGSAGAVFMVTLVGNSSNLAFLEGCLRAFIDDPQRITWLSSGTEDFFLSAYYFNAGLFQSDDSGVTYVNDTGFVSAYKFFEKDPLLFTKSFELWWRCSDNDVRYDPLGCPQGWPERYSDVKYKSNSSMFNDKEIHKKVLEGYENGKYRVGISAKPTTVTTYTWIYEW